MSEVSRFVPDGTLIDEPTGRKVTLTFPTNDDAIIFYQTCLALTAGEMTMRIGNPILLEERLAEEEAEEDYD